VSFLFIHGLPNYYPFLEDVDIIFMILILLNSTLFLSFAVIESAYLISPSWGGPTMMITYIGEERTPPTLMLY
jgi:hypothetical protein